MVSRSTAHPVPKSKTAARVRAHVAIMRLDHWPKNGLALPGVVLALAAGQVPLAAPDVFRRIVLGLFALGLAASANYTLNEVLDAPSDRLHPTKRLRPVPSGMVHPAGGLLQWAALGAAAALLGWLVSPSLAAVVGVFLGAAVVYNARPIRAKDWPVLDIVTEAVNNPIRLYAGWCMVAGFAVLPVSLIIGYWMLGAFFMAAKRFGELNTLDSDVAISYRRSFRHYTLERLLSLVFLFGTFAMLMLGSFLMRYRLELALAFPVLAALMAYYAGMCVRPDTPVQEPARLWREPIFTGLVIGATVLLLVLLFIDIPGFRTFFEPTIQLTHR